MRRRAELGAALIVGAAAALTASRLTAAPESPGSATAEGEAGFDSSGRPIGYDLRRAAAINAPIIGTISGFVVTAVVLVFGIAARHEAHRALLDHATGLLTLGLIGCLVGAFAFAAIAAEARLTSDLPAAALQAGTCTGIGIVSILAAFEVLSTAFLPESKTLFAVITGGSAVAAVVFVGLLLGDVWMTVPDDHWLGTRHKSGRRATALTACCAACVMAALASYAAGVAPSLSSVGVQWFVGTGIVISIGTGMLSLFRTFRSDLGEPVAIGRLEAYVALGLLTLYSAALVLLLP